VTEPTRRLDAPGLACIDLTPLIASTMREMQPDDILEVHTDDPAARVGVPAWCRLTRNPLVYSDELVSPSTNRTTFLIAKKNPNKKAIQQ
jgi:tRNA 2-thiouridine synthesizing protein A